MGETLPNSQIAADSVGPRFADRVPYYRERVNTRLNLRLSGAGVSETELEDAMRYAALGGGKRIRPLFVYASCELLGVGLHHADAIATAVELVHAYSLIHDDLPAMDDDALRRGRPTVHVRFGEASAILAGDALQALAFQVLSEPETFAGMPESCVILVNELSRAVGGAGMVGGQALDLAYSGHAVAQRDVEEMFIRKTGKLIAAAITLPLACISEPDMPQRRTLVGYAGLAGLCFQIHDDVLDITKTTVELGKPSGSDARNDRAAYPTRFGLETAKQRAAQLLAEADLQLDALGPGADGLRWLTGFMAGRQY